MPFKEIYLELIKSIKMVPKVDKCCCCFSLQKGCYFIAIFNILQSMSMVKIARFSVSGVEFKLHPGGDDFKSMVARHVLSTIQLVAGNLILFGTWFKIPLYLRISSVVLLLNWGGIVVLSATAVDYGVQKLLEFLLFLFSSCVISHFFKVLWNYCIFMEREPFVEFPTDTFPSKMYVRAVSPLLD